MKKKKLKAKIRDLKAQIIEERTSAVAAAVAKMLLMGAMPGGKTIGEIAIGIPSEPEKNEPEFIGALRRAAMKAKSEPK